MIILRLVFNQQAEPFGIAIWSVINVENNKIIATFANRELEDQRW